MRVIKYFLIMYLIKYSESIDCNLAPKNTEGRLRQDVFCTYDPTVRPVSDHKNATIIKIKMIVKNFDYEDTNNRLRITSWMAMSWKDDHLKWDASRYDNLKSLHEQSAQIWTPDIALYNSDIAQSGEQCTPSMCLISNEGVVVCIPPCSHEGFCSANYKRWPFDQQNCSLMFGTWVNTGEEVNFDAAKTKVVAVNNLYNKQWKMISASVKKSIGNYSCCPGETFPTVKFTFILERHSVTHAVVILAPALIMVVINLITLWLEPERSDRIILTCLSLLAHFLYMQQLSWYVPSNGDTVPDVVIFFRDSLVITAYIIVHTTIIRSLSVCELITPMWLETCINKITNNRISTLINEFTNADVISNEKLNDTESVIEIDNDNDKNNLIDSIKENTNKQKLKWKLITKIIDRLLFVLLTIIYCVMLLAFIPESYIKSKDLETPDIGTGI